MKTLFRLLALHRPRAGWLLLGLLLALATLLANVVLMAVSGWFIAAMAAAGATGAAINYFTPAAVIRACAIVRTAGRYGERLVTHDATLRILSHLRGWLYERLEPLAPADLGAERSGALLSRFTGDIETLDNFYLRILLPATVAAVAFLLFLAWLWWQSPKLALLEGSVLLIAGLLLPWLLTRRSRRAGEAALTAREALRRNSAEMLHGFGELLLYGAAETMERRLEENAHALARARRRAARFTSAARALGTLGAWIGLWGMLLALIPEVRAGKRMPAELPMFALFALAAFEAAAPLPEAMEQLSPMLAAARRLFEIADRRPTVPPFAGPPPRVDRFDILFEKTTFRYPHAERPALREINLVIPEGTHLAVVGPTGAGKSTLVQLLSRFHLPQSGRLELGGTDLRHWPDQALHCAVAVADQESRLFIGTVRENLRLARPNADEERLVEACRTAQLASWLERLPNGLDTEIGEAALRISGGEARRLTIARALLREAPVLVLDEPTEGLDPATARRLMEALVRHRRGRTLILITHRTEPLPWMERVVLLDQGRILASGDHAGLLARSKEYRLLLDLEAGPAWG